MTYRRRGDCTRVFHRPVSKRSVPLKSLVLPPASEARPRESNPPGFSSERSVNAAASQLPPTAANLSSCEESHEQTATLEECPNWASAPRNPKSPYLKEGAPVREKSPNRSPQQYGSDRFDQNQGCDRKIYGPDHGENRRRRFLGRSPMTPSAAAENEERLGRQKRRGRETPHTWRSATSTRFSSQVGLDGFLPEVRFPRNEFYTTERTPRET